MSRLRGASLVTAAVAASAVMAACGGGTSTASGSTPSGATSTTAVAPSASSSGSASAGTTGSPSPAATESNPPGDIPDTQAYVEYRPPAGFVAVKVPEGWARTNVTAPSGPTVLFSDKLNRVAVTTSSATGPVTPQTVRATVLPQLTSSVPKFALTSIAPITRPAGTGVLVRYQGDSPQDPVTGKVVRDAFEQYLFSRGGKLVSLTLSGPTNADNVDPWRIVSQSLRWV